MDNAGKWKHLSFLVCFAICGNFFTFPLAHAGNSVPVMLWLGESSNNFTNPLYKITKNEFEEILHKPLSKKTPPLILFVKDSLCIEDIKPHKNLQQLNNAGSLSYLTSVDSALDVFENLKSYTVSYPSEDDLDSVSEGQLAILRIADLSSVPEIYSMLKESSPNLKAALTGKMCSYTLHERSKRAVKDEGNETKPLVVFDKGLLFYADSPPTLKINDNEAKELGSPSSATAEEIDGDLVLTMNFASDIEMIKIKFGNSSGYHMISGVDLKTKDDANVYPLVSNSAVFFPKNYSYHCESKNLFSYYNKSVSSPSIKRISLAFTNLQIQLNSKDQSFSQKVYDCIGIFSIPILSGIFVTVVLGLIMIWALLMIMDINTNDRFDDPKGKTITVTAQE